MRIAYVTETWHPSMDGVVTRLEATLAQLARLGHQALVVAPRGRTAEPPAARSGRPAPLTRQGGAANPAGSPVVAEIGAGVPAMRARGAAAPAATGPAWNAPAAAVPVVAVPSVGLGFLAGGKPWGLPTARVGRALRRFRPDVVHVLHPFVLGLAGVAAARRLRLPLVASFHQDIALVAARYHLGWLGPAIWAYTRRLHGLADITLVTSHAAAATVAGHRIGPPLLWPYGVDLDLFHPARRNDQARERLSGGRRAEVVALYVGRLAPEKDLDRLAPLAADTGVHLAVVGDGPLRPTLERRFGGPSVTFLGPLTGTALAEAYASADVFVFPSTTETLGLVLLEALASGLPVVAVETDTSREILAGDDGGRLCPADALELFTAMVREVGTPGAAWHHRSRRARQAAQRWSWRTATERLLAMYEAVIDADRHAAGPGR